MRPAEHVRNDREAGVVLLAVMIALVATASLVAGLYLMSTTAGRSSEGQLRSVVLDDFNKGIANVCALLVDAMLSVGDYAPPNTFQTGQILGDTGFVVEYDPAVTLPGVATLREEVLLSDTNPQNRWFSDFDAAGNFVPDVRLRSRNLTALVDLDLLESRQPAGQGVEFGQAVQGQFQTVAVNTYRCYVEATDDQGRGSASVMLIKKEIGS